MARIGIVDDNKDIADSYAMIFKLWGHEPRPIYDGESALRGWKDSPIPRLLHPKDATPLAASSTVSTLRKKAGRKMATKREHVEMVRGQRFVRRDSRGQFKV